MKKKTLWILAIVFCVLIVGASILYNQLKDNVERESLVTPGKETADENSNSEDTSCETDISGEAVSENTTDESSASDETTEEEPYSAPDFTVYDFEGNEVHLSDYIGKPVIVNFWASWCGPCKSEMPSFEEAYTEYKDKIQFMVVNMTDGSRETVESASAYIKEQDYTFPVFYDTQSIAAYTYQVYAIPTTYFIDTDGNLVAAAQNAIDRETLQKGIDMIYSE